MRRSLGFKLRRHDLQMRQLVAFLKERKARRVTTKLALEFATRDRGNGPKPRTELLALVRGFAKYQAGLDPLTEIPPMGLLASTKRRAKPYLYSKDEVDKLTEAALQRPSITSLLPWTYHCIFGLLAVTGMRVSEVLNLQCDHIDWAAGILTVHETKFGKTRLVPLHSSTVVALADYKRRRRKYLEKYGYGPVSHFFVSRRGRRLHATSPIEFWELSADRPTSPIRRPWTAYARSAPSVRGETLPGGIRPAAMSTGGCAVDLHWSHRTFPHVMVFKLHAQTHGDGLAHHRKPVGGNCMKVPAELPPLLESFFTQRLMGQRKASPHTITAYRDTFSLLLKFAQRHLGREPSKLTLEDLNAVFIASFLDDLESGRHCCPRSRNLRLAAIRSFFRYAAMETPQHAD
jgi:integrase